MEYPHLLQNRKQWIIKMKKAKKKYYCRYCGKKFDTFCMAEICFDLDMKILQNEKKNLIPVAKAKEHI